MAAVELMALALVLDAEVVTGVVLLTTAAEVLGAAVVEGVTITAALVVGAAVVATVGSAVVAAAAGGGVVATAAVVGAAVTAAEVVAPPAALGLPAAPCRFTRTSLCSPSAALTWATPRRTRSEVRMKKWIERAMEIEVGGLELEKRDRLD